MPWLYLLIAGLLEVAWAVGLKSTEGFSRLAPSILVIACMVASMGLLGLATRELPVGTAYAVWVGIGIAGTAVVGVLWLGEPATPARLACLALVVAGIIGLKLTSS